MTEIFALFLHALGSRIEMMHYRKYVVPLFLLKGITHCLEARRHKEEITPCSSDAALRLQPAADHSHRQLILAYKNFRSHWRNSEN